MPEINADIVIMCWAHLCLRVSSRCSLPLLCSVWVRSVHRSHDTHINNTNTPSSGWKPLSGNEIGTLLADWLLSQYRARHPDTPPNKLLLVNTTVSSKMMQLIAKVWWLDFLLIFGDF